MLVGEGLRRPEREREERLLTRRSGHPRQHVLMREHAGGAGVGHQVVTQPRACGDGARENAEARLGELLVTADMVGVHARVDDVADRQRRQPADRRQHLVRHRGGTGVDEDDALGPDLHDDVAARAADHVEVRPQLHDLEIARRRLLGGRAFDPRSEHEDHRDREQGARGGQFSASDLSFHGRSQIPGNSGYECPPRQGLIVEAPAGSVKFTIHNSQFTICKL